MCVYVCDSVCGHVFTGVCTCACRGQRQIGSVFVYHFLSSFLTQDLSLDLNLNNSLRLTVQRTTGVLLSLLHPQH